MGERMQTATVQMTKTKHFSEALERELLKHSSWQLMFALQDRGKVSAYGLAKELGWSTGKIHSLIRTLQKARAITVQRVQRNGRTVKLIELRE